MSSGSRSKRAPIVITGSEGSGTNFVGRAISASPDVGGSLTEWREGRPFASGVYHVSIPHGRGMSTYWPRASEFDGCRIVIVRRGLLDSTYSAYRRFYKPGMAHLALRHQLQALQTLTIIRSSRADSLLEIEYESLGNRVAMRALMEGLGLQPGPESEEAFRNQNGAYLKDPAFLRDLHRRPLIGRLGKLTLGRIRSRELASRRMLLEEVPPPVSIGAAGGLKSTLDNAPELASHKPSGESS